jgi:dihydrofolate reductase|nr:MAG TPA: Dihydrofolate reductase [Caudoviricetes sp.]
MAKLSAVYCTDRHGIIGLRGENTNYYQPINCKLDKRWFIQLTKGKTVLMGANTARALVEETSKLLPNRKNIVLTTNRALASLLEDIAVATGCDLEIWSSLEPLESYEGAEDEIVVIGGVHILNQLHDKIDTWYVTEFDCDVTTHRACYYRDSDPDPFFFPNIGWTADNFIQEGFERVAYSAFSDVDEFTNLPVTGYFVEYKLV